MVSSGENHRWVLTGGLQDREVAGEILDWKNGRRQFTLKNLDNLNVCVGAGGGSAKLG